MISAAVIIATFNREDVLIDTINSVLNLKPLPDEIFVIDQTFEHTLNVKTFLDDAHNFGVKVIHLPLPGVCYARNLGAALSKSDILIYIDDDVIISDPLFIENHKKCYTDSRVSAVQGQIIEGNITYFNSSQELNRFPLSELDNIYSISTFVTANASIRRSALLEIGGFDEGYSGRTYANEDGDLGMRLTNAGYKIILCLSPILVHLKFQGGGNRITAKDDFPEWTRSVTFFQYALRHYYNLNSFIRIIFIFRLIALRKDNLRRPWMIPWAILHCLYALWIAIRRHKKGFMSSLFSPGIEALKLKYKN